eukprot:50244-Hanusia_phi.AAC.1
MDSVSSGTGRAAAPGPQSPGRGSPSRTPSSSDSGGPASRRLPPRRRWCHPAPVIGWSDGPGGPGSPPEAGRLGPGPAGLSHGR